MNIQVSKETPTNTISITNIEKQGEDDIKIIQNKENFRPKKQNINEEYSDDELGFDQLANTSKMRAQSSENTTKISFNNEHLHAPTQNPIYQEQSEPRPNLFVNSDDDEDEPENVDKTSNMSTVSSLSAESSEYDENSTEILKKKEALLFRLRRYEQKGMRLRKQYSLNTPFHELKAEVETIKKQYRMDSGVAFCKKALVAITSGIEFLNHKFDPFDLELDGWSSNVAENQDDYDEVFEDLYEKYADKVDIAPEIKLMLMVGGSALTFHITQKALKKGNLNPSMLSFLNKNTPRQMGNVEMPTSMPPPNRYPPGMRQPSMKEPQNVDDILKEMNLNKN